MVDTDAADGFASRVLAVVATVPAGTLVTYGEVAAEAGHPGAARAVGRVLAGIGDGVPWWRVVPASGRLAARQAAALQREGVTVHDGRVRRR
jgi:methylated-DNA-protein-cysteine methyltransferase-like protein